jgi:hypothetical protein
MASWLSKTLCEHDATTPEEKLWRAVLNQALVDAFSVNTIWITDQEKNSVDKFFRTRSEAFDELCDKAGVDPTRLWRKVQRLKGVQAGFLTPAKKEIPTLKFFERFKRKREHYVQSHWRYNVG